MFVSINYISETDSIARENMTVKLFSVTYKDDIVYYVDALFLKLAMTVSLSFLYFLFWDNLIPNLFNLYINYQTFLLNFSI